jgi:glycosyltransferase involved in cell wall biosynthesis
MVKSFERLRIGLITEHASPLAAAGGVDAGGQNIYVNHVARVLAQCGHRVDVFTRRDHADLLPIVHVRPGLRVVHVPAGPPQFVPKEQLLPFMADFSGAVERFTRGAGGYDVLHANFFMSGLAAMRVRRSTGIPFVITMHALGLVRRMYQGRDDGFPAARTAIETELVRTADRVIAECPQDREDLIGMYGAPSARIATVPCGFDPNELAPCDRAHARRALSLPENEFIVLQLGRLVPRKGVDNVIRAMAPLVHEHRVRARLLIVGGESEEPSEASTPEIGRLRAIAEAAGVAAQVHFVGRRDRDALSRFYSAADAFVTTPWYEPFGITPLEAMACGTPVVGAAVGGIKSTVVDGVTGFLVPPRDPQALARKLAVLAQNPMLARALGRGGIRRARSLYTWERVTERLLRVYVDVVKHSQFTRRPIARPRNLVALPEARR